ncbi:MAG: DUF523 domain-containing protein [Eubacteriaceae bacterium]|jgi:uncharacterized protein YbbK (DUF523 family)|nr:DUF523 domain-containing protein [Eubacteriaceae bacterium]
MYIISACLLGTNCKYDGGSNATAWVKEFAAEHSICAVCPETLAGLLSPRDPCELVDGRVFTADGRDLTDAFTTGAENAYKVILDEALVREEKIEGAILKSNSPSCGCGTIYDGTFSHTTVSGDGVFAKILLDHGIRIITEKERIDD